MRIQILSDLHMEHNPYRFVAGKDVDVLVLAGDICDDSRQVEMLDTVSGMFKDVIYVLGNHEHWGTTAFEMVDRTMERCDVYPNIHFLNRDSVDIGGKVFHGVTLWSDFRGNDPLVKRSAYGYLNDRRYIHGYDYDDMYRNYLYDHDYLKGNVCDGDIVISHYMPSLMSVHDKYRGSNLSNDLFVGHCDDIMEHNKPSMWIHGHTHSPCSYDHWSGCKVYCNPRGYSKHENPEFGDEMVVKI
jgi:Icc-related predicted phosphoesterase